MDNVNITIERWAAWAPGLSDRAEWQAWAEGRRSLSPGAQPDVRQIPPLLRRRLSPLGKMALSVAWSVMPDGEAAHLPAIFASRHGELERTVGMLQALNRGEALSPTQFSLSVHNAVSGVFSIARNDTSAITALALNAEGPSLALLEAGMILRESGAARVLCVIYDEPLPRPYADAEPAIGPAVPHAAAFLLSADSDVGETLSLCLEAAANTAVPADEPAVFSLIRYLLSPAEPAAVLSGLRHDWRWSRSVEN